MTVSSGVARTISDELPSLALAGVAEDALSIESLLDLPTFSLISVGFGGAFSTVNSGGNFSIRLLYRSFEDTSEGSNGLNASLLGGLLLATQSDSRLR